MHFKWWSNSDHQFLYRYGTQKWHYQTLQEATYVCLNHGEAYAPEEIRKKSICINGDIGEILISIMEER